MNLTQEIEAPYLKKGLPQFRAGDTVRVHSKIREGDKERTQAFEGVVIRMRRGGIRSSFTVRKISFGIGVERIFPLHSPVVERIEVVRRGRVRRAKLYYLRRRIGKHARVRAEKMGIAAELVAPPPPVAEIPAAEGAPEGAAPPPAPPAEAKAEAPAKK